MISDSVDAFLHWNFNFGNEKNIREYANCGVNFISVGDLTHNIKGIDLSLNFK